LREARAAFEELLRRDPRDAEANYTLGAIAGQERRFDDALHHFRQTVQLQPDAVIAHCGLGAAYKAIGHFAEAERAFREAVRLQPRLADAMLELACVLLHQAKIAEAERCFREVLALKPTSAEAYHGLGEVHSARREVDEEIRCYRQALALNAGLPMTHQRLGIALLSMGMFEESLEEFAAALRLHPGLVEVHKYRGIALTKLGMRVEARAAYQKALELNPDYLDALVCEADLLEQEGEVEEAYAKIAPLLERGEQHPGLGMVFANLCRRLGRCDEAIDYLERLISDGQLPVRSREYVHFSLGKVYDGLGKYDAAFANFRKANDLRPHRFNPERHTATFTALIETFDRAFLASASRAGVRSHTPVFIVGMPRSGTSLVEQILASHPEVFGAGELGDIGFFVTELAEGRYGRRGYPDCFRDLSRDVLDRFARRYLDQLRRLAPDARRVTDKLPQNFQHLGLIALLFPEARVIHCVRESRDTCLSIYFQPLFENVTFASDLRHCGLYYRQYERLMAHWREVLDLPILDVRYEELIANQDAVSRQIVAFAGLEWDERCIRFYKTKRTVATCSYEQVQRPIYSSSIARWKHYERYLAPLLKGLGGV
jgi:tetratricopeptide (TPR) repeat protein